MKKLIFLFIGAVILLSSCRPDPIIVTPPDDDPGILVDYEPTVIPVNGSVDGFVTDENGDAIQGAIIKLGGLSTSTNEDGHFDFLNTDMNQAGTLIRVTAPGYFDGSRRFLPTGNGVDRVRIQLLQKQFDQSLDGAMGGAVSIPGGTGTINFPANGIVDADGDLYTGTVDIAVKYLDPSAEITSQQMPGDLFGVNEDLEERMLATYGMIAVELVDDNGSPLNIGENETATINMPVPASMQGNAPATIPLWSYNEEYGVWVEEGEATLINGSYVGEVTHFSWWNCDVPLEYVALTATLTDQNGDPLKGYTVKLTSSSVGTGYGYTNSHGVVSGIIPAGETLLAEVLACNTSLHTQNIGPFTNPISTIPLTANASSMPKTSATGTALCNGNPLNNYLVIVTGPSGKDYLYASSPTINWERLYCGNTSNSILEIVNLATQEKSNPISIAAGTQNNIGNVDACQNNLSNYFILDYNGSTYLLSDSIGVYKNTQTYIDVGDFQGQSVIRLGVSFDGLVAGSYSGSLNDVSISINNTNATGQMTSFDVTTYTTDKLIGSFSGTVLDNSGVTVPVSSSFSLDY